MTRTEPFTFNDCIRSMHEKPQGADDNFNNEGLVAIISLEHLSEEYRKPEYQLFRLSSGFGCKPTGSGRKCYGTFCFDGADDQFGKYSFIGIANEETTKIAEAMESEWDGGNQSARAPDKEEEMGAEM